MTLKPPCACAKKNISLQSSSHVCFQYVCQSCGAKWQIRRADAKIVMTEQPVKFVAVQVKSGAEE